MSKHNKVNRDRYTQRGRLTPDEAARERMKQIDHASTRRMEGKPHSQLKATTSGDAETDPADAAEDQETNEDEEQPEENDE